MSREPDDLCPALQLLSEFSLVSPTDSGRPCTLFPLHKHFPNSLCSLRTWPGLRLLSGSRHLHGLPSYEAVVLCLCHPPQGCQMWGHHSWANDIIVGPEADRTEDLAGPRRWEQGRGWQVEAVLGRNLRDCALSPPTRTFLSGTGDSEISKAASNQEVVQTFLRVGSRV